MAELLRKAKKYRKDIFFYGFFVAIFSGVFYLVSPPPELSEFSESAPLSKVVEDMVADEIESLTQVILNPGSKLLVTTRSGNRYAAYAGFDASSNIVGRMMAERPLIKYEVIPPKNPENYVGMIVSILTMFFFGFLIYFVGKSLDLFGSPESKTANERTLFDDVAGIDEAKENVREVVDFLRNPEKYAHLGGRIPRGILLCGDPGNGKTLLAKAVAGEANANFIATSGSEFIQTFVGTGAARVRKSFAAARKKSPSVIFIDEIDAIGKVRGNSVTDASDERGRTLNQLLVEMDGFGTEAGVVVIAATNRPEILDPALLRAGRFDRKVYIQNPDVGGREAILRVHARKYRVGEIDFLSIAKGTTGFSGADLANLLNEAAILATRENAENVCNEHVEKAKEKILLGDERRNLFLNMDIAVKRETAFHESGHAVVAHVIGADPVHRVTIVPREKALGVTLQLPDMERYFHDDDYLKKRIAVLMGGRAAEEVFLGKRTNGAMNDIAVATALARKMVTQWGMSDAVGPVHFSSEASAELTIHRPFAEDTQRLVDSEISALISAGYNAAKTILEENSEAVEQMVERLLDRETIMRDEIIEIMGKSVSPSPLPSHFFVGKPLNREA